MRGMRLNVIRPWSRPARCPANRAGRWQFWGHGIALVREPERSGKTAGEVSMPGHPIIVRLKIATETWSPRRGVTLVKIQFILLSALLALPAFSQTFSSTPLANPSGPGSLQPNWSVAPDGAAVFSWTEPSQGSFALRYAVRHGGAWSPAITVAAHRHFFHHPAEMPEVLELPGGHWFAHWVEAPEGGDSDAEYVYVSYPPTARIGPCRCKPIMTIAPCNTAWLR